MTPPAASDAATERQTVGDILLARGYISQPQLEQAVASQQQSGKPLGQVLVEAGAITRLELASALAEQWSDTATWLGPPEDSRARDPRRQRQPPEESYSLEGREAGYAQQLQDAVVELARRVALFEPTITDLKLRMESAELGGPEKLLDRIEVVQDAVSALARRLDELTDGVERAFAAVETSTGELAGEIDELKGRAELVADARALDEVRGTLEQLAARPAGDPALTAQVDTLAERLEELREATNGRADTGALETLRLAHDELAERVSGELEGALEAVRASVAELAGRPQADPGLAERLEELTGRIEALAGTDALDAVRSAVEEIAGRPAADPELESRLDEVRASVAELAARPQADPALADRLEELAARIEGLAAGEALDEVRASVAELAARPQADPALAERLEELTGRIEALAGTDAVDAVRAAVDEIAGRPAADPELESRLEELTTRLDTLAARHDETAAAVHGHAEQGALEALQAALAELDARVGKLADTESVDSVRATIEEIAGTSEGALHELREQLAQLGAAGDADPDLDRRVDNVVARLDALHARVEEVAAAAASEDADAESPANDLVAVLREELESRIEAVASRTDGLAEETAGAVGALASERDALEARVEALARELTTAHSEPPAAAQPLEQSRPAKAKAKEQPEPQGGVEAELERLRMAVERINMHLGERERAIADLMRSRSAELTMEELARRVAELERGGAPAAKGAAPAGDAETSSDLRALASRLEETEQSAKADRDKLLTQLERMAASIDWRFRRLESGETDAAA